MGDGLAERMRLLDSKAMHRSDIEVRDGVEWRSNEELATFFRCSNFEVRSVEADRPLRARFAVFPHMSIVHVSTPRAEAYWPRDETSLDRDRALVIVTTAGALEIETDGIVLRRPDLTVLCPGESPVVARLTGDDNEIVYSGVPPSLSGRCDVAHRVPADRSGSGQIRRGSFGHVHGRPVRHLHFCC